MTDGGNMSKQKSNPKEAIGINKKNRLKQFFQTRKQTVLYHLVLLCFAIAFVIFGFNQYAIYKDQQSIAKQTEQLQAEKARASTIATAQWKEKQAWEEKLLLQPIMLKEYAGLYEQNADLIGWLSIEDTNIDYPVVQTLRDENYYLYRDFQKKYNKNGTLIMDTDSIAGIGAKEFDYINGSKPSTNLIIHGHAMHSGLMFGKNELYASAEYGKLHNIIHFDSLYEKREYELISVFYSQVYFVDEEIFKYYKFFQANSQEEFDDWYENIKHLSLYDTGVTAAFGDEFITLSTCSYDRQDGRFVIVGKRIDASNV